MKEVLKFTGILFIILLLVWGASSVIPKIVDIYKYEHVKPDTIYWHDTIYFEKIVTDSFPDYHYITEIRRDTFYKWKGDSVERIPRLITLKKKVPVKRCYLDRIR